MDAFLEIHSGREYEIRPLSGARVTVGRDPSTGVGLPTDRSVSRIHAVLENLGAGWTVRDLGSSNGTRLNGEPLSGEHTLREADEITLGDTRLIFHAAPNTVEEATVSMARGRQPELTRREREVLIALCRPKLSRQPFAEAASVRQVAVELVVTEDAIKQHLLRLYDKFDIGEEEGERRRVRLAREAILRGIVRAADVGTQRR